jgi:hypothetical protein
MNIMQQNLQFNAIKIIPTKKTYNIILSKLNIVMHFTKAAVICVRYETGKTGSNYNMETKHMYIMAMATVFHEEIP